MCSKFWSSTYLAKKYDVARLEKSVFMLWSYNVMKAAGFHNVVHFYSEVIGDGF